MSAEAGAVLVESGGFVDVPSVTTDLGSTFITGVGSLDLDVSNFTSSFNVPYEDLGGFGTYQQAGSLAGNATWNDFFNRGDLISGPDAARVPGFGDAVAGSLGAPIVDSVAPVFNPAEFAREFGEIGPGSAGFSLTQVASQVQTEFTNIGRGLQQAQQVVNRVAPVANLVSGILRTPNPLAPLSSILNQATAVAQAGNAIAGLAGAGANARPTTTPGPVVLQVTPEGAPVRVLTSGAAPVPTDAAPVDPFGPLRTPDGAIEDGVRADTGLQEPPTNVLQNIQEGATGFIRSIQDLSTAVQQSAPLVNAVTAALGVPNPFTQAGPVLGTAVNVAQAVGAVAGLATGGANARPTTTPGAVPAPPGQISYDTAIIYRGELEQDEIRLRNERNEIVIKLGENDQTIRNLESQLSNPELTQAERDEIARELIVLQAENGELEAQEAEVRGTLTETRQQLANANAVITQTNASAVPGAAAVPSAPGVQYATVYNPTTNTWSVYDSVTGETAVSGLSEQQAREAQTRFAITAASIALNSSPGTVGAQDPRSVALTTAQLAAQLAQVNNAAGGNIVSQSNAVTAGLTDAARNQAAIRSLRNNKAQSSDWRVRLRLAPNSNYLYNEPGIGPNGPVNGPGIMAALRATDGVVFPYTPSIETAYKANYEAYDLTHSNYRGYFYRNSYVDVINLRATFTAQDTNEANYLLAVIHFFRSATKMFYGQDSLRGAPPPLVYLNGYGNYQFNEHPCVISQFNYNLPPDVDYIRCQSWLNNNTNLQLARLRNPIANNPLAYSVNRLLNSRLLPGAKDSRPSLASNLADGEPTYVPTKMEISISLLPIQSRAQVSQNFSVKGFADGNLLKGGYW
jgi:hypothetical protein